MLKNTYNYKVRNVYHSLPFYKTTSPRLSNKYGSYTYN